MINLPKDVSFIINKLNENGFKAYIVGGCVRDFLMGKVPKDWDITTQALPLDVKRIFNKTVDTGIEHGTVTVVIKGCPYEVTTFRIDGKYTDGRHPDNVSYTNDLKEDLLRRDFTINAIAYSSDEGFIDPFGGISDIEKKVIKGVGDPSKRFEEDALRMLRAVRFSATLDFSIDKPTYEALLLKANLIEKVSIERTREEFLKTLFSNKPENIKMLIETKLFYHINKDIYDYLLSNFDNTIGFVKASNLENRLCALLCLEKSEMVTKFLKFLKFDNVNIKEIPIIINYLNMDLENDFYKIKKYINEIGIELFNRVLFLKSIVFSSDEEAMDIFKEIEIKKDEIILNHHCIFISDLKINGNDLKDLGIVNGKKIGECLKYLLDLVHKEPDLNDFSKLESIVRTKGDFYD